MKTLANHAYRPLQNPTFARYNGKAVVILANWGATARVRYTGDLNGWFLVRWDELTEF